MRTAAPQMFWLLPVLVLPLIGFLWWAWRKRQEAISQFISARLLGHLKVGVSPSRQKWRMVMMVATVVMLIVALARPQWGMTEEEVRQRGLDIVVAIDTSKSMLAEDISPNRLARAKLAAIDLARKARTDRLGLVAFAGTAFLQCPLTLDDAAFSQSVDSLDTQTISQGGTAIAEAIDEATKAFKHEADNHKVVVLFTDGEDHDSEAAAAAERAAKEGVIIFTVGIGTPEGEQLRIKDERGRVNNILDEQGKPVKSHLNEELLQEIAREAGGFYLPLRGSKTMDTLYEHGIAPLPKSEGAVKLMQRYTERYRWPLGIAMAILILEMFLPDRRRRRSARTVADATTKGIVAAEIAAVILLLFALPTAASAGGAGNALREYNQGKYEDALKDYNQLLEKKNDDPRLHFNAGAAAYQSKQLDEASRQFKQALSSPDLKMQQQSYYNLGNTFYRLGEQVSDMKKKQEAWEESLKNYESAQSLNKQDTDVQFNQDFVKKQLEELKKQQQQQQNQDKKDQNKKDSKDNDKNSQQQQNQKDQQKQDQQQKDKSQQDQDSKSDKDSKTSSQDQQKQDQKQAGNQSDKQKQDQAQQKQAANGEQKDEQAAEEEKREQEMMAAGQMTPQQAKQLLDAQKGDEQVLRLAPPNKNTRSDKPFRDW